MEWLEWLEGNGICWIIVDEYRMVIKSYTESYLLYVFTCPITKLDSPL